jgi:formylglycine-generating enzyme required for sulfatase activity
MPPDRFPPRLASLGYQGRVLGGVEVILPPLCDVPSGEFLMGSDPAHDRKTQDAEKPQHWVTLAAYAMARYPVTVAEYACYMRSGHAEPKSSFNPLTWQQQRERFDHPVVNVTWHDARSYAAWLSKIIGMLWRLPTEAEWEKAARWDPLTRTARIYPWGDTFGQTRANTFEGGMKTTTPVDSYSNGASPCGAQDMAGNVWEWINSLYKPYPYSQDDGRESQDSTERRVLRGGSWSGIARNARAAYRLYDRPVDTNNGIGFRVVRAVPS